MKIKLLTTTALAVLVTLFIATPSVSAFSASDCKKGTMYYDYNHAAELGLDRSKLTEPKDASEIKTIADCNLPKTSTDYELMDKATLIINVIVGVIGLVAIAVIVLGGVFYTTSVGDTAKTKKAQNTIIYGIVGLVIALLAFAIVNFVLKNVFS